MADDSAKSFRIFRAADAPSLSEAGCMTMESFAPAIVPTLLEVQKAGVMDGESVHVLVDLPGFSLTHVWFKKEYPLPLHSHDAECLYYVIAGSIRLGTETLGPRDAFFVPADVPYSYRPGSDGVELLEFRHATQFNFVNHANGVAFWKKALETVKANHGDWERATMPALNA